MPNFTVSYSLRYEHVVQVGLTAGSSHQAIRLVRAAFDAGLLWDDTPAMRLLQDNWEECDDNVLTFEPAKVLELPAPDFSVQEKKRHDASLRMLKLLRVVSERCPVFTVADIDLPTHAPVLLEVDEIRAVKACVAALDGC